MLATQRRLTTDDIETLAAARRDRIARERPGGLAERAALVAKLSPPDEVAQRREAAHAAELDKAERALIDAKVVLERALDRACELRRERHGRGHEALEASEGSRRRLREPSHPAVAFVERALADAAFAAMAITPSIVGFEATETPLPPTEEEARRVWFRPSTRTTRYPVSTHGKQAAFIVAIGEAHARVEDLTYQALDDDAVVTTLRAELDQLVSLNLPLALAHVQMSLSELRRKLDGTTLDVWSAVTEDTR
jgi:hypothetical protein